MKIEVTKTQPETIEIQTPLYRKEYGLYSMIDDEGYIRVSDNIFISAKEVPPTTVGDILKGEEISEEEFNEAFLQGIERMRSLVPEHLNF
jgi:hypothetical protein